LIFFNYLASASWQKGKKTVNRTDVRIEILGQLLVNISMLTVCNVLVDEKNAKQQKRGKALS